MDTNFSISFLSEQDFGISFPHETSADWVSILLTVERKSMGSQNDTPADRCKRTSISQS